MDERLELIEVYENMMYSYGYYDTWDDDIQPKLDSMSTEEIRKNYEEDKEYYEKLLHLSRN